MVVKWLSSGRESRADGHAKDASDSNELPTLVDFLLDKEEVGAELLSTRTKNN